MAPLSSYFKGSGSKVMKSMKSQYGAKKGKSVFYATANSRSGMGKMGGMEGMRSVSTIKKRGKRGAAKR